MVPDVIVKSATGTLDPDPSLAGRTFQRYVLFFGRYSNSRPNRFGGSLKSRRCVVVIFFQAGSFFAGGLEMLRWCLARSQTRWLDRWLAKFITSNLIERSSGTSRRTSAQTLLFSVCGIPGIKPQSMDTDSVMYSSSQSG